MFWLISLFLLAAAAAAIDSSSNSSSSTSSCSTAAAAAATATNGSGVGGHGGGWNSSLYCLESRAGVIHFKIIILPDWGLDWIAAVSIFFLLAAGIVPNGQITRRWIATG